MDTHMAAGLSSQEGAAAPAACDGSKPITFQCRKGIACWNMCCSDIDIALTPYDVLRLKQHLKLSSGEFLRQFTLPVESEPGGLPGVRLRPTENGTACPFTTRKGCSVYPDRPIACRYYPVAPLAARRHHDCMDTPVYAVVKESYCLGHNEPKELTIDAYLREQEVADYDAHLQSWRDLTLKAKALGVARLSHGSLRLFTMACYDLDAFRDFVVGKGFNELYDLTTEETIEILGDDTKLMQFGFRLLKQVLLGENSIPLKHEGAAERIERQHEEARRMEQEAVEQRLLARNSLGDSSIS